MYWKKILSFWMLLVLISGVKCYFLSGFRSLKLGRQLNEQHSLSEEKNETSAYETSVNNVESKTTEDLFWTIDDINNITEAPVTESEKTSKTQFIRDGVNLEFNSTFMENTESSLKEDQSGDQSIFSSSTLINTTKDPGYEAHEEILLHRNNCNLEIAVEESYDTRILIKFEPLKNPGKGKCYVILNCLEKNMLGIFLSNIHLYHSGDEQEYLKVVVKNSGPDFVLKQYHGRSEDKPLLLTETHQAYIILYYNITTKIQNDEYSQFNLEAFTYHKHENHGQYTTGYNHSSSVVSNYHKVENIFITTEEPFY